MIYAETILATASSTIGVAEQPWGSNRGPGISFPSAHIQPSFQSTTGAYGAAWCASWLQWVLEKSGYGSIANRSAGAYYCANWMQNRGWQVVRPQPADVVVFFHGTGHIGIVDEVRMTGFYYISGNSNNSVNRLFHPFATDSRFYRLSNVRPRPRVQWLPRFEAVGSKNGHEVVVARWGRWAHVAKLIPPALAKGYSVRVKRKLIRSVR